MTAQLNVVNPGGAAQSPHRDYHLGFQSAADIERYPLHVQLFSPMLTLQGAIAHVDAPMESGPTLLLPFSQAYEAGYLAMNRPDFKAFFEANHVQLPLEKGDMLFFSPALLHAAGTNRSKRYQADGQSLPGVVGLWPRNGEHRPVRDVEGALSGAGEGQDEWQH